MFLHAENEVSDKTAGDAQALLSLLGAMSEGTLSHNVARVCFYIRAISLEGLSNNINFQI